MSRPKNKDEYRAELAAAFAGILEEKGLNWTKEWNGGSQTPRNGVTGSYYHGINVMQLALQAIRRGYKDPRWVTMVQIMDKDNKYHAGQDWHLKKGSSATYVEYWYPYDLNEKKALSWEQYRQELLNGREPEEFKLSTRYIGVFNADEVEGMPPLEIVQRSDISQDILLDRLSENMGVPILNDGGDRAYYSPDTDTIHLPAPGSFTSTYDYNSTALHELSHSTGHSSRLARLNHASFGSEEYAYEELVAEMCACFMGTELQTEATSAHIENHKAYVQSWIQAIREKPDMLVKAIKDAERAANYMDYKAELITVEEYERRSGKTQIIEATREMPREVKSVHHTAMPETKPRNYIAQELVALAREQDVLDILRRIGEPLIEKNHGFRSAEHNSLIITPGEGFYWFSRQKGSRSPIDYFRWVHGMSFQDATRTVLDALDIDDRTRDAERPPVRARTKPQHMEPPAAEHKPFALPVRAENNKRAYAYLTLTRRLDPKLISSLMEQGLIYQEAKTGNTVFAGWDYACNPVSAFKRSTLTNPLHDSWTRGDAPGSQKDYRFRYENPDSRVVNVFESEIDMLSYLSMHPEAERVENYISLGGVSDRALEAFLEHRTDITEINICTDNDAAGNGAAVAIAEKYSGQYEVTREVSEGKDWNEDLVRAYERQREAKERERSFSKGEMEY